MIGGNYSKIARVGLAALAIAGTYGAVSACSVGTNEPSWSAAGTNSGGTPVLGASGSSSSTAAGSGNVLGTSGSSTGNGGSGTVASAGSTGSETAGASGSGTGGAIVPLCTTKIAMKTPGIASFESYDGTTAA